MPATIECPFCKERGKREPDCPLCKGKGTVVAYVGNERDGRGSHSKYGNIIVEVDGYKFDSGSEAVRYGELVWRVRAGEITDLRVHPLYPLYGADLSSSFADEDFHTAPYYKVADYEADFSYVEVATGKKVVEDVKGTVTDLYSLKKRWMRVQGIHIVEIKA